MQVYFNCFMVHSWYKIILNRYTEVMHSLFMIVLSIVGDSPLQLVFFNQENDNIKTNRPTYWTNFVVRNIFYSKLTPNNRNVSDFIPFITFTVRYVEKCGKDCPLGEVSFLARYFNLK